MFNYARSDTHFLLFIYDHLRNELVEKSGFSSGEGGLIAQVLEKSKKKLFNGTNVPFTTIRVDKDPVAGIACFIVHRLFSTQSSSRFFGQYINGETKSPEPRTKGLL